MLTPKKKFVKKDLKQDTLLTTYVKTSGFYYENKKYINYALTALVVVVVAVVIYVNNQRSNNDKANAELAKVMSLYDRGVTDPSQFRIAIDGKPDQGVMGLQRIVDNYSGTDAGQMAVFYLAGALYHTGEWARAAGYYREFDAPDRSLEAAAKFGAGACHEALKEFGEAAKLYEDALRIQPAGERAPEFAYAAVRAYARSGDGASATRLVKQLREEYPDTEYARNVDRLVAEYSL